MKPFTRFGAAAVAAVIASGIVWAQGRGTGAEWPTTYGDAQRTSWIRTDLAISVDSMSQPGFELQWKTKLVNQPRQMNSLSQGVTVNGVTLFTPLSTVAGSSNNVFALDNDTGNTFWTRHFNAPLVAASTDACPGGLTAAPTRMANLAPAPLPTGGRGGGAGGGGGRGGGYSSNVSQPGEGVQPPAPRGGAAGGGGRAAAPGAPGAAAGPGAPGTAGPAGAPAAGAGAAAGAAPGAAAPGAAGQAARGAGGAGGGGGRGGAPAVPALPGAPPGAGGGGFGRPSGVVYVLSSDGVLHTLGFPSGIDVQKPVSFVPANARASDLMAVQESLYLYTTTSHNCGGAPNGVWAMDMSSGARTVTSWKTNGGSPVGSVVLATDGTLLVAIGASEPAAVVSPRAGGAPARAALAPAQPTYSNAIVALDPKTLQVRDWYTQATAEFVSTPLVFKHGDKDIVAAATKDGRVLLLDASSLGGANHATPLFASRPLAGNKAAFAPDALAMWQELIPIPGAQAAALAAPAPAAGGAPGGAPAAPPAPTMQLGTRWLLVPVNGPLAAGTGLTLTGGAITDGAVVALKVVDDGGRPTLQPGWASRNLASPAAPIVVNGVVFTGSSGKAPSTPAVLYAFNGVTGKELWNSGKTLTSFMSSRSFWTGTGQIYAGTFDGTVYAFGFANERK